MMGKILLVTGGARSGKSRYAEKLAGRYGKNIAYLATAEIYDGEMAERVALHQARRPKAWQLWEAPYDAHAALEAAGKTHDLVLFDCLTLYVSNLLCSLEEEAISQAAALVKEKIDLLIQQAQKNEGMTIFVTNEVGAGIVPENALGRAYRDLAGWVNQWVAAAADDVFLVVCGIPVNIKALSNVWGME